MSNETPDGSWIEAGTKAIQQARHLLDNANKDMRHTERIEEQGRETKIQADQKLHNTIASILETTGLPVYSEEGNTASPANDTWCWVIDPLDGSANYQRGLTLCASSIALCQGMQPQTGFIYDLHQSSVIIGGAGVVPQPKWQCADTKSLDRAILCTGIPARLQWSEENTRRFGDMFRTFYKIRMLGSVVQALLHVASGRADAYYERNIMFWDVAAAWAIAKTAGVILEARPGTRAGSLEILATTPALLPMCRQRLLQET